MVVPQAQLQVKDFHAEWKLDGHPLISPRELREQLRELNLDASVFEGKANSFIERRGIHPSTGCLLLTRDAVQALLRIHPAQDADHKLTITDGSRTVTFNNLIITRVTAIKGQAKDRTGGLADPTAMMVEVADIRYFGTWLEQNPLPGRVNHTTPEERHWRTNSVRDILNNFSINNHPKFSIRHVGDIPDFPARDVPGETFEAYCNFLDAIGSTIAPTLNAGNFTLFHLWDAPITLTRDEQTLLAKATSHALKHHENDITAIVVPDEVHVIADNRNFQFDPANNTYTPNDRYDSDNHATRKLTANAAGYPANQRAKKFIHRLHVPYVVVTDDQGAEHPNNWKADLDKLGRAWYRGLNQFDTFHGKTYTGIWPIQVGPVFSAAAYYNLGEGTHTRHYARPRNFSGRDDLYNYSAPMPTTFWNTRPGEWDHQHRETYSRSIYGILQRPPYTYSGPCITRHPGSPPNNAEGLATDALGKVSVVKFEDNVNSQIPNIVGEVEAFNFTDNTIPWGKRVWLRYNYQVGRHGRWEIVAVASTSASWQEVCIPKSQLIKTECVHTPTLVSVRKNSSLQIHTRNWPDDTREVILGIRPGPDGTIFQSRGLNDVPRWTFDPYVKGSYTAGGWYKFAQGGGIGPPSFGATMMRLPSGVVGTGSLLRARSVTGNCVDTEWEAPGLNAVVSFSEGFDGVGCSSTPRCVTLVFSNGRLVGGAGFTSSYPYQLSGANCFHNICGDYDPCSSNPTLDCRQDIFGPIIVGGPIVFPLPPPGGGGFPLPPPPVQPPPTGDTPTGGTDDPTGGNGGGTSGGGGSTTGGGQGGDTDSPLTEDHPEGMDPFGTPFNF